MQMFKNKGPFDYLVFDIRKHGCDYKVSKNFKLHEYQSRCGHPIILIHPDLIKLNQKLRDDFNTLVHISSAYRTEYWNDIVGGTRESRHLYGMASDVIVKGVKNSKVMKWAKENDVGGIGEYEDFTHLDVWEERRWIG